MERKMLKHLMIESFIKFFLHKYCIMLQANNVILLDDVWFDSNMYPTITLSERARNTWKVGVSEWYARDGVWYAK